MRRAIVMLASLAVGCACAQVPAAAGAIPPPAQTRDDSARASVQETWKNGALALPGAIFEGSAVLQHRLGQGGAVKALHDGRQASAVIGYLVDGSRLLGAGAKDGVEGLKTEGAQIGLERATGAVGELGATLAVRQAIASGASAVTASGGAGLAYAGGSLIGGWARDSQWLGKELGLDKTIGHEVDRFYWNVTPDWAKELASGTRQVDVDSPEFEREMAASISRRRHQLAFERVLRENAEQQRQAAASVAATTGAAPIGDSPSPAAGSATLLDVLNESLRQSAMSTPPAMSLGGPPGQQQCRINPQTGCHYGHDEKSHPGGCRCGR